MGFLPILAMIVLILGSVSVYETDVDGVHFEVIVEDLDPFGSTVAGTIKLKITNNNDFIIGMHDINVELSDPSANGDVFSTIEHDGAIVSPGETIDVLLEFSLLKSSIPEDSITVHLTGKLVWNGETRDIDIIKTIQLSWEQAQVI